MRVRGIWSKGPAIQATVSLSGTKRMVARRYMLIATASGTTSGIVPLPRSLGHFTGRKWLFLVYFVMIEDEIWYTSVGLPMSALE